MTSSPCPNRRPPLLAVRAALGASCALALLAGVHPALAQTRRGPLVVLGLRAPNGDDEAAANMTNALRRAARDAGFDVPDNSPALEQSMAAFGCDESVPADCLAQIAGDLHAQRMVYGEVRHHGHGAAAQLEINTSFYDNATHSTSTHDTASAPRPMGQDNEALNPIAHRMIDTLLPPPAPVAPPPDATQLNQHHAHEHENPPPGPAVPIRRYIGFGAIGVGVVGVGVGLLGFGLAWNGFNANLNNPDGLSAGVVPPAGDAQTRWLWQTYMVNATSGGSICSSPDVMRATTQPNMPVSSPDAQEMWRAYNAHQVCNQASGFMTGEWGFVIGGAVLAAVGVVLVVTDNTPSAPPASASSGEHTRRAAPPTFALLPTITPNYQGADFVLRF